MASSVPSGVYEAGLEEEVGPDPICTTPKKRSDPAFFDFAKASIPVIPSFTVAEYGN